MSTELTLTKTRIQAGVWEGELRVAGTRTEPRIEVSHLTQPIDGVEIAEDPETPGRFILRVPIPREVLYDGVQSFVITEAVSGEKLGSFTIVTGQPLEDDVRAEMALLREELDMLKRAFRRHCLETT
ncbi:hypothetical protein [Aliiroseovarius sp.]|uniref:hypothetical protein n=1 Tax=Aliiroseovarius sp. TaxID=1872442 RepID=UPI002607878E|nr:hypothetical protein [Aliiroseovarius sp.]